MALLEKGAAAAGVGIRVEHVFTGGEVKGHDLEQALRAGAADDGRVPAGFDLHNGCQQARIDLVSRRPMTDCAGPVLDGGREEGWHLISGFAADELNCYGRAGLRQPGDIQPEDA